MFIVKPKTTDDLAKALLIISYYQVIMRVYSDTENINSIFIEVFDEDRKGDLRLAEMAFQMNFSQFNKKSTNFMCPLCEQKGEECCGHLVFTEEI